MASVTTTTTVINPANVLTHYPRETTSVGQTTYTFVADGIEAALEQARGAAGEKDVSVGGGAKVIQQYLAAGLLDELQLTVVPLLHGGRRAAARRARRQPAGAGAGRGWSNRRAGVTHLRYAVG